MKEMASGVVRLEESATVVNGLLEYIYCGCCNTHNEEELKGLLLAARKYLLEPLWVSCRCCSILLT
jgi:hypothetical protein